MAAVFCYILIMYRRPLIIITLLLVGYFFWKGHRDESAPTIEVSANSAATAQTQSQVSSTTALPETAPISAPPNQVAPKAPIRKAPGSAEGDDVPNAKVSIRPETPVHWNNLPEESALIARLAEVDHTSYSDLIDDTPGLRTEQGFDQYNYSDEAENEQLTQWKVGDEVAVEEFVDANGNTIVRRFPNNIDGNETYQTSMKDASGTERGVEKDRDGRVTSTWTTQDGKTVTNYYDENGILTETVQEN